MLRPTSLTISLTLASIVAAMGSASAQTTPRVPSNTERVADFMQTRAVNCDAHRHESASLAVFAVGQGHLLLRAAADVGGGTGRLAAYSLDRTSGDLGAQLWEASRLLPEADARRLVTTNSDGSAIAFRWTSLDDGRRALLQHDPAVVEYVRGNASNERSRFRSRGAADSPNRLGAIIDSLPVVVGPPAFAYGDELERAPYSAFRRTYAQRPAFVYVGASDGMLHAFDAQTGIEAFAVLPGELLSRIGKGAHSTEATDALIDGSPSVGDAFVGDRWRTLLLTGMGRGGRSVIALDITDPTLYASLESDPSRVVLWEFSDVDLGFTHSRPVIARLRSGTWAAVFGSGYMLGGTPVLYVVDLATGKLIRKLDPTATKSVRTVAAALDGLSTPAAVDVDNDRIVDYVYAGDLSGNLWKFDLRSADQDEWNVALGGEPLYQARSATGQAQPVTFRPEIVRGEKNIGLLVLFVAGSDPQEATSSTTTLPPATLYGIADRNDRVVTGRGVLSSRQLAPEVVLSSTGDDGLWARTITFGAGDAESGWYMDFAAGTAGTQVEQVLSPPLVRDGHVTLLTRRAGQAMCGPASKLWTISLDVFASGAERNSPAFDINRDGKVDSADTLKTTLNGEEKSVTVGALGIDSFLSRASSSLASIEAQSEDRSCRRFIYLPTSPEKIARMVQSCSGPRGRQSWRQVR